MTDDEPQANVRDSGPVEGARGNRAPFLGHNLSSRGYCSAVPSVMAITRRADLRRIAIDMSDGCT